MLLYTKNPHQSSEKRTKSPKEAEGTLKVSKQAAVCVVPSFVLTGDELSDLHVVGLPQQADEGWDAVAVLDGDLVVVVFAVGDVAQGSTGLAVNFRFGVVQEPHKNRNPLQLAHIFFNLVVFVAQVLQVGSGVGFDGVDRVPQHGDDLWEVRISPARVLTDAVYGWRAPATHPVQTGHAPPLWLGQRGRIHAVDVRVALINQLCLDGVVWVPSERQNKGDEYERAK